MKNKHMNDSSDSKLKPALYVTLELVPEIDLYEKNCFQTLLNFSSFLLLTFEIQKIKLVHTNELKIAFNLIYILVSTSFQNS